MSEVEAAKSRAKTLYQRMKEAREIAQTTLDGTERRRQLERVRILRDMYQEATDEVARLEGRTRAKKKHDIRGDHIFDGDLVWSDISGSTWSHVDGMAWQDIQSARNGTGRQNKILTGLLNDALAACTDRQKEYIHEYYKAQKTMEQIAKEYGVNKGSVSRVIKAGMARVAHHVVARLFIAQCLDGGTFDYVKFVQRTRALTERQTELLYLALTDNASYTMIAAYLGRNRTSVYRGMDRAEERLRTLRVDFIPEANPQKVKFKDWCKISERELAERMGLSRRFYFATVLRGRKIHGVPLYHYYILCGLRRGRNAQDVARAAGCSERLCNKVNGMYGEVLIDEALLPEYHPVHVDRTQNHGSVLGALRDLTRGCNAIIDRIDADTLRKLKEGSSC